MQFRGRKPHIFLFAIALLISFSAHAQQKVSKRRADLVRPLQMAQPHVKKFGGQRNDLFKQSTTERAGRTEISFDITLGDAYKKSLKVNIENASGKKFNRIGWFGFHPKALPPAVSFVDVGSPGAAGIPYLIIPVGIPLEATNFTPFLKTSAQKEIKNIFLYPRPIRINDSTESLRYEQTAYEKKANLKGALLSAPLQFRTLRFVTLRIPLAEFNAKTGVATVKTKLHCGITFERSKAGFVTTNKKSDPLFSGLYSKLVANSSDIPQYAVPFHSAPVTSGRQNAQGFDGPRTFDNNIISWIDRNAPYVKLSLTKTGLYRITADELSTNSGITVTSWKASDVRMFNKGVQVPIWIDTTSSGNVDAIEFFGERLKGFTNEYYNWSTDTNAYWLTDSRSYTDEPLRFIPETLQRPDAVIMDADITLHHERDYFYYGGDGGADESATLHRTDWIPGERFVWFDLKENTSVRDTLFLPTLPSDASSRTVKLEMFVRGISRTDGLLHKGEMRVNGVKVTEFTFADYDSILHLDNIPLSVFQTGANAIDINYLPGTASGDQWYLDFYRMKFPIGIYSSADTAIAKGEWDFTLLPPANTFRIEFQSNQGVSVYNLSTSKRLLSAEEVSGVVTDYFDSAAFSPSRYLAASSSSFLKPDRISAWNTSSTPSWSSILDTLANEADYIIITHPDFLQTALKLEFRRKQAGLRTKVVQTDEIYNAFNFGSNEPWAIRRFLQYAFDFYKGTPPSFITLFGDATWDPKFILNNPYQLPENRSIHKDFVPTYGVPSSDYLYTTLERTGRLPGDIDTLMPNMIISRIPVETSGEADRYLSKLIDYESQPPAEWNKNFLFVMGGDEGIEHLVLMDYLNDYLTDDRFGGLLNPPMTIKPTIIERTDFTGVDLTHVPDIQTAFRTGQSLVYFFGHGATFITDVFFGDPSIYRNAGLYPVLLTLSCRTGAFSEPNQITLNEAFLRADRGGVIMANGSTGFDDRDYVYRLSYHLFNILRGDSASNRFPLTGPHKINMPMALTAAKVTASLIDPVGGSLAYAWYNSLQQHSILGDAAMGFGFRPQPEFNIAAKDVAITDKLGNARSVFSVSDSFIVIKAKVSNFGYSAETPVHISIVDEQPGGRQLLLIDTLERLDSVATTGAIFTLDTFAIGANTLRIKIDYDNQFAETNENDNEVAIPFQVNGFSATPFFPPEGAKNFCDVTADSIRFTSLVPSNAANALVELEVDTTILFTNPRSFGSSTTQGIFYERSVSRSDLPKPFSNVIWWRTRLLPSGGNPSPWLTASLDLGSSGKPAFSYSTADQLAQTIVSGLTIDPSDGSLVIPTSEKLIYDVIAHGVNDSNSTLNPIGQIFVNGSSKYSFTGNGVAVAVLKPDNSGIDNNSIYEFINPNAVDSATNVGLALQFDSVIKTIPAGRNVIVLTNFQPFIAFFTLHDSVTRALKSLGSRNGFDKLEYFGSYALIGMKGAAPGTAKEEFGPRYSNGVELFDTLVTTGQFGSARTPPSAVALRYGKLSWTASNIPSDSTIVFDIYGEPATGGATTKVKSITSATASSFDISDIDARVYPRISVQANFSRSSSTTTSPKLSRIAFEYDPAPEFVVEPNALIIRPDTVTEEGRDLVASYSVKNLLCIPGTDVPIALTRTYHGKLDTVALHNLSLFAGRSAVSFSDTVRTTGFAGDVLLTSTANYGGKLNEQLTFNNTASRSFHVGRDSSKPKLDVLYDKIHINDGDYVAKTVQIVIRLTDQGIIRITDTSSIVGVLQLLKSGSQPIFFTGKSSDPNFDTKFAVSTTGDLQAELIITPKVPLVAGRYTFSAAARDASGNTADTLNQEFVISDKNGIDKVMNWPNPFKDKTYFTFIMKGTGESDVKCYVYTVAGRKIRTLTLDKSQQHVGLNKIEWDGHDEQGNDIANGTYLYRLVLNGSNDDGSTVSEAITEKAVRSR
jgi:hypothetical protein